MTSNLFTGNIVRSYLRPLKQVSRASAAYRIPRDNNKSLRYFTANAILEKKKHGRRDDTIKNNNTASVPDPTLKIFNLDTVKTECDNILAEFKDAITKVKQGLAGSGGQLGKIPITAHIAPDETSPNEQHRPHHHKSSTTTTKSSPVKQVPLESIATITPGNKKIIISVYDPKHVQPIIAGVMNAGLNLNPQINDLNNPLLLTIHIPPITNEMKLNQLDEIKNIYEKFRRSHSFKFSLDKYRSIIMTQAKKAQRANIISKDDLNSQIDKAESLFKEKGQIMLSLYERAKKSFE